MDSWSVVLWRRDRAGNPLVIPFRCGSWRCPRCWSRVSRSDFVRIEHAVLDAPAWVYVVLTFDPARWPDRRETFSRGGWLWNRRLRKRIERLFGKLAYVQTWESTRRGWAHVNVLLRSDALLRWIDEHDAPVRRRARRAGIELARVAELPRRLRRWLRAAAIASGFGKVIHVELVRSSSSMAGYLAKLAGELVRSKSKPGDQRPIVARKGFRRLRSSKRLLPPRRCGGGEWTGALAKRPVESWGAAGPRWIDANHLDAQRAFDAEKRAALGPGNPVVIRRELLRERASAWRAFWRARTAGQPSSELAKLWASSWRP